MSKTPIQWHKVGVGGVPSTVAGDHVYFEEKAIYVNDEQGNTKKVSGNYDEQINVLSSERGTKSITSARNKYLKILSFPRSSYGKMCIFNLNTSYFADVSISVSGGASASTLKNIIDTTNIIGTSLVSEVENVYFYLDTSIDVVKVYIKIYQYDLAMTYTITKDKEFSTTFEVIDTLPTGSVAKKIMQIATTDKTLFSPTPEPNMALDNNACFTQNGIAYINFGVKKSDSSAHTNAYQKVSTLPFNVKNTIGSSMTLAGVLDGGVCYCYGNNVYIKLNASTGTIARVNCIAELS